MSKHGERPTLTWLDGSDDEEKAKTKFTLYLSKSYLKPECVEELDNKKTYIMAL